jgi:hypothetical protein
VTFVGAAGLFIALSAVFFADLKSSRLRISVFALLFVLHTAACGAYYLVVEVSGGDAKFYYNDDAGFYGNTSGLGTAVILNFVQYLKINIGGTLFDYFLLFQAAGFWGLVIVAKIIQETYEELSAPMSGWVYLFLFLPGQHYWTAGIGKDGPVFLGVALSIWAVMRISTRLPALGVAFAIMVAVRPHIGVLALAALGVAGLLDRRTKGWVKLLLIVGIFGAGSVVAGSMQSTYFVDTSSAESVGEYMEAVTSRGQIGEDSGADLAIVQGAFPLKVASLWLRPFFLDAENAMGYVASLENVALLFMLLFLTISFREVLAVGKKVLYVRYSFVVFMAITLLLAAVNYNVGLGLRQKMMAMPALLVILATLLALRAARRQVAVAPDQGHSDRPQPLHAPAYLGS